VSFAAAGVQPQSPMYVTCDDSLEVDTFSSAAPVNLSISARVLTPQGRIDIQNWSHTPATNRSQATSCYPLAEGWLLSVVVMSAELGYLRGHCWCVVSILHGAADVGLITAVLLGDYATGSGWLGWPGGFIRSSVEGPGRVYSLIGSAPAAGAEISQAVPTNALWRLLALEFGLTTGVAAATRLCRLVIDDGTNDLQRVEAAQTQVASLTKTYSWGPGMPSRVAVTSDNLAPIPQDTRLPSGFRIRTVTDSIQAADQYTAPRFLLEEWIQP